MATSNTGQLTAEDLLRLDSRGVKGELIRGVLCQHDIKPRPWDDPSTEFPGILTAEDFDRISQDSIRRELLDGELFDTAPLDEKHISAAKMLESGLRQYVLRRQLGLVRGMGTGVLIQRNPDSIRAPHILYVPALALTEGAGYKQYIETIPAWVCEIVTPEDYQCKVSDKTDMWLRLGVLIVVEVYPAESAVMVHRRDNPFVTLTGDDVLDGGEVLPGFSLPLNEIFDVKFPERTDAMATAKNRLLTAEDLLRLHSKGVKGELIDGVLKEKVSAGVEHSFIGIRMGGEFDRHARRHRLGRVGGTDGGVLIRRNPDNVREPDIFFVSAERLPLDVRVQGYLEVVPELVVEIVSPSDRERDVREKISTWLELGVSMTLEVRPADRAVMVHRPGVPAVTLTGDDALDGGDILPGFSLPLSEIFDA